jgi:diaminopimelate epimerase
MDIQFSKYQGTGNDFVIIDNRDSKTSLSQNQIAFLCDRRKGIGADGLMLLGGRCLVQFAHDIGIVKDHYHFIAVDGPHEATMDHNGWVHLKMSEVNAVEHGNDFHVTNTGSPHYIKQVKDISTLDVYNEGKSIRYNERFSKEGINVNFVEQQQDGLFVRTYERGVENETYSCGTGVTAAALIACLHKEGDHTIHIETLGGKLAVKLHHKGGGQFNNIWLMGSGTFVFKGNIHLK